MGFSQPVRRDRTRHLPRTRRWRDRSCPRRTGCSRRRREPVESGVRTRPEAVRRSRAACERSRPRRGAHGVVRATPRSPPFRSRARSRRHPAGARRRAEARTPECSRRPIGARRFAMTPAQTVSRPAPTAPRQPCSERCARRCRPRATRLLESVLWQRFRMEPVSWCRVEPCFTHGTALCAELVFPEQHIRNLLGAERRVCQTLARFNPRLDPEVTGLSVEPLPWYMNVYCGTTPMGIGVAIHIVRLGEGWDERP